MRTSPLQRRVRRLANRLITRRRYRANRSAKLSWTTPLAIPVWTVKVGPHQPGFQEMHRAHRAAARKAKAARAKAAEAAKLAAEKEARPKRSLRARLAGK